MTTSSFATQNNNDDEEHDQDEPKVFTDVIDDDGVRRFTMIDTSRDDAELESDYSVDLDVAR